MAARLPGEHDGTPKIIMSGANCGVTFNFVPALPSQHAIDYIVKVLPGILRNFRLTDPSRPVVAPESIETKQSASETTIALHGLHRNCQEQGGKMHDLMLVDHVSYIMMESFAATPMSPGSKTFMSAEIKKI